MDDATKTMHLFAGGGGGLLADLILGHKPVCAVEWEPYACQSLRERTQDGWFPDLQVWEGDVRLFDPSEYAGRVDCIHAGFPCQDLSFAGAGAGIGEGTRSGLYREVLRIADVVRPRDIFLENVSAILARGLGVVLGDLSARGYSARWVCLRASDVGARHHRDRWWLLARKMGDSNDDGYTSSKVEKSSNERGNGDKKREIEASKFEGSGEQYAYVADASKSRAGYKAVFERGYWSVEPDVGRVANGVANRVHRLKVLGNGQVPLQAATAYMMLEGLFS